MIEERLQKVLARAGVASRRAAEELIVQGRVRVDGRVVRELGTRVASKARVEVDGQRVIAERLIYLVLHKPRGVVSTLRDPEGRPTVSDLLKDVGHRVVPVGRLDYHTSGALLFTNDGEFAERLMHPKGKVPKEYVAKVRGVVDDEALERWRQSIVIDGRATRPADVKVLRFEGDKTWLSIVLFEGRNRQVRRLGEATGFPVLRLARLAQAGITTEGLRPGQWRALTMDELIELKRTHGVPRRVRPPEDLRASTRSRTPGRDVRTRGSNSRERARSARGPHVASEGEVHSRGKAAAERRTLRTERKPAGPERKVAGGERGLGRTERGAGRTERGAGRTERAPARSPRGPTKPTRAPGRTRGR